MNIRTDFVTNSSSASFMLAYKQPLGDEQLLALGRWAANRFLGDCVVPSNASAEELKEAIEEEYYFDDKDLILKRAERDMRKGLDICAGYVSFEGCDEIGDVYTEAWRVLEMFSEDFDPIATNLSY